MTAQGHPRAIFKRTIDRGNLVIAEMAAREVGIGFPPVCAKRGVGEY